MSTVYLQPKNPVGNLRRLDFPYTPQIEYSQDVKYDSYAMSHTNYQTYGYTRTENPNISMTCKFSAHTKEHFDLSEHAIRFLRTYSKMNFGRKDILRGLPPRILRFYAYGNQVFENVPVVINKFSMTFPEDVDYVKGEFDPSTKKLDNIKNVKNPSNEVPLNADGVPETVTDGRPSTFYLPMFFTINISLLVQQNLFRTVNEFTLENFSKGMMSKKGYV